MPASSKPMIIIIIDRFWEHGCEQAVAERSAARSCEVTRRNGLINYLKHVLMVSNDGDNIVVRNATNVPNPGEAPSGTAQPKGTACECSQTA